MSIEQHLSELTSAIKGLTAALANGAGAAAPTTTAEAPAKQKKAVKAEAPAPEAIAAPPAEAKAEAAASTLTLEDIMPIASELVNLGGGDELVAILNKLTNNAVSKVKLLPANLYDTFKASASAAVAAKKAQQESAVAAKNDDPLA